MISPPTSKPPIPTPEGGLLALDLGSTIGWAYGPLDWPQPLSGYITTPVLGGQAPRFQVLDSELCDMIEKWQPTKLAVESPLHVMAHDSTAAAALLYGMRAIVLLRAYGYEIPLSSISADLVRQDLMGFCRIPGGKRGAIKDAVLAWCRHRKHWQISNHNAADAALIWAWHQRQLVRPRQLTISPEMVPYA
jgi:Holliday junction resolvasome RuvABC endonuclease subunit